MMQKWRWLHGSVGIVALLCRLLCHPTRRPLISALPWPLDAFQVVSCYIRHPQYLSPVSPLPKRPCLTSPLSKQRPLNLLSLALGCLSRWYPCTLPLHNRHPLHLPKRRPFISCSRWHASLVFPAQSVVDVLISRDPSLSVSLLCLPWISCETSSSVRQPRNPKRRRGRLWYQDASALLLLHSGLMSVAFAAFAPPLYVSLTLLFSVHTC